MWCQTLNLQFSSCSCFPVNYNKDNIVCLDPEEATGKLYFVLHPLPLQKAVFDSRCILYSTGELASFFL